MGVERRHWIWPIGILAFCHMVAIASAQIVNILVDDIKASLVITDFQYSLLQGVAVALFAALLGIPVASLADRRSRKAILVVGVAGWTIATAACAFVQSFGQLFAARVLVGIGEVFLFPAASSLILDLVPRGKLARAIALFGCGGPIGAAVALAGGGWLLGHKPWLAEQPIGVFGTMEPWRLAFLACALLGILALILLATLREPARGPVEPALTDRTGSFVSNEGDAGLRADSNVFGYLASHVRLYGAVLGGMLALCTAVFATTSWLPTILIREQAFTPAQAGGVTGIAALVFAVAGTWAAGFGTDMVERRGRGDAVLRVGIVNALLLLAGALLLPVAAGYSMAIAIVCGLFVVLGAPTVLSVTAIQQIAPARMRARVVAIYVLLVGITAAIVGPSSVAALHERVFTATGGLGLSLTLVDTVAALTATLLFLIALPGFRSARRQSPAVANDSAPDTLPR